MREDPSVDPVGEKLPITSTNGDRFRVDETSFRRWKSNSIGSCERENATEVKTSQLFTKVNDNVIPNREDSNIMCLVQIYF